MMHATFDGGIGVAVQADWMEKDLYAVLGVTEDSDPKAISRAYRELARKLHPDTHPDDPDAAERFKEVTAAYDVIGDEAKRAEYDEFRRAVAGARARGRDEGGWNTGDGTGVVRLRRREFRRAPTDRPGRHSTARRGAPSTRKTLTTCSAVSSEGRRDAPPRPGAAPTSRQSSTSSSTTRSTA